MQVCVCLNFCDFLCVSCLCFCVCADTFLLYTVVVRTFDLMAEARLGSGSSQG